MMTTAYLSLGSNVGDSYDNLQQAVRLLHELEGTQITRVSSIYETDPVGVTDQPAFLNIAVEAETAKSAKDLLAACLDIEAGLGRKRGIRWGPRIIDLDILLYDDDIMESDTLMIPHPRMHERSFVLIPLLEINPGLHHPSLEIPFSVIQEELGDREGVRLWKKNPGQQLNNFFDL
ncbi:2-amino-4-hydroxy-6-hydroxymethyldihydropteridine diphosphokinase [Jeotgalibacillus sp. S-D1]|uniref:2-amino-4-hydroxy-6- hydroxymethyldihydropteridine diphosphokinase n=1 Tax=Jeotgalibacillus sp. S-D1 TaxID=2552189 RepID=UPI001059318A|nr:2-amino-4-hydroxy-6-hydroxymethyldihydropteridine diphosphokinase [Jeotgalibacillus sp. S-D1]TDL30397.1 2-amino-4-hydroxy-6-hydroxymethyldihydropteridine diphosphokinase [Jeotgalibacillus sp. S-D1]